MNTRSTLRVLLVAIAVLLLAAGSAEAYFGFGTSRNLGRTANVTSEDGGGSSAVSGKLKVLFIGNSYTSRIQGTLDSLVRASPYSESTFEYVAPGSWTLLQHLNSDSTMSKIRSQQWDFVVLQEQSQIPTLPARCGEFYDAVAKLSEAIKQSGGRVVLYMTWGRRDYDSANPEINPDYETMQQRLVDAYTKAAHSVHATLAPVGLAWQRVRRDNPERGQQLYDSDGTHPSYTGAFLVASVLYATLFHADPTQLDYNGLLTPEEATYLKGKAKEAFVLDVDFNDDGMVDMKDLLMLIQYWGQDEPLVDIGPMPWGDGKVDEKDLEVLMSYWGQEVNDPTLIAHWKLDEVSGMIATDSAGSYDGVLERGPVWQPSGGTVAGAIQLDGVDDYIKTPPVLSPSDGTFSLFAWVKGGAPGQVILSQQAGVNWLKAATPKGELMTELMKGGRGAGPLTSSAVLTDGAWHRVGLVWDSGNRILYVDDVEVARDTQTSLGASAGGLYIGASTTLAPGSFWSGLIDDVRIYNRAVKP